MKFKSWTIILVFLAGFIFVMGIFTACEKKEINDSSGKNIEQNNLPKTEESNSSELNNESAQPAPKEEIWNYYSKKDFQIDGVKTFVDKKSDIIGKYGKPVKEYLQSDSYLGEAECFEYEGMTIYFANNILIDGVSDTDDPYVACLVTTKAGTEGLDGIKVGDSIKKLKFSVNEKLKNTTEYVYAFTPEGVGIEDPTPDNLNYDNSYCIIEYSDVEGSGNIRFINNWFEFVIIYDNQMISKMLINAIVP